MASEEIPRTFGRYEILGLLGRGSMARVYLAHDPHTDRRVALKVMAPVLEATPEIAEDNRRRFLQEARAAGRLHHPGIVVVYDADTDADSERPFIAMEWVPGHSLAELLRERRSLPWANAATIAADVALALDHAHERGIVHRDVKPANILLADDGRVKVSDFGIAKFASESLTQSGEVLGTPKYMSPEQVRAEPIDGRSDLFSLGAVLYEMLTGTTPFPGQTIASVAYRVAAGKFEPPSTHVADLPAPLERLVTRALARDADERFQSGQEMARALRELVDSGELGPAADVALPPPPPLAANAASLPPAQRANEPTVATPRSAEPPLATVATRPPRWRRRLALAAVLLVALAGAGYLIGSGRFAELTRALTPDAGSVPAATAAPPRVAVRAVVARRPGHPTPEVDARWPETPPEPPVEDEPPAATSRTNATRTRAAPPEPAETSTPAAAPVQPAAEPAPERTSRLEILHFNRLNGAIFTVWVDGQRAWSTAMRAPRNFLRRVEGDEIHASIPLTPGVHTIEVRVDSRGAPHLSASGIVRARFQPDSTRSLHVVLLPYVSKLALSWEEP